MQLKAALKPMQLNAAALRPMQLNAAALKMPVKVPSTCSRSQRHGVLCMTGRQGRNLSLAHQRYFICEGTL